MLALLRFKIYTFFEMYKSWASEQSLKWNILSILNCEYLKVLLLIWFKTKIYTFLYPLTLSFNHGVKIYSTECISVSTISQLMGPTIVFQPEISSAFSTWYSNLQQLSQYFGNCFIGIWFEVFIFVFVFCHAKTTADIH